MLYTKQTLAVLAFMPFALLAQKRCGERVQCQLRTGITSRRPSIIDKAIENPKANIKEKTWRYRGNIYTNLAADSALYAQVPDALGKGGDEPG